MKTLYRYVETFLPAPPGWVIATDGRIRIERTNLTRESIDAFEREAAALIEALRAECRQEAHRA